MCTNADRTRSGPGAGHRQPRARIRTERVDGTDVGAAIGLSGLAGTAAAGVDLGSAAGPIVGVDGGDLGLDRWRGHEAAAAAVAAERRP